MNRMMNLSKWTRTQVRRQAGTRVRRQAGTQAGTQAVSLCYLVCCLVVVCVLAGCVRQAPMRQAAGSTWGTTYHIKYRSDMDLADSIVAEMRAIDLSLSPFVAESQISRVNRGERVVADSMLRQVLALSQRVCRASGGAFDPTVAPLVNLWGFGYRQGAEDVPTDERIDSALMSVGVLDCGIDSEGCVYGKNSLTEFNFSAVAKGYGVDRIASMLRRNGCTDYMVEVGGEMALSGDGPNGDGWVIQVDAPVSDSHGVTHQALRVLRITDACIATSGNYRNYRPTSEGEVGHTISPRTGRPVRTNTLSATVIAESTALADALATAIMAMPEGAAEAMIDSLYGGGERVGALIVRAGQENASCGSTGRGHPSPQSVGEACPQYRVVETEGFTQRVRP